MNDSHSQPDNSTPKVENGFLFEDWNLPEEKNPIDRAILFDGKIIARMPDLGSESVVKNIEKPKFPSFWGQMYSSVLSVIQRKTSANTGTPQRFFHRVTSLGGIVLLCGVGIHLISTGKNEQTENAPNIAEILAGSTVSSSVSEPGVSVAKSAFSPVLQSESRNIMSGVASNSAIPVAPVESITAVSPPSPWDRPASDSHSPWGRQSENLFQPVEVAAVNAVPTMPHGTVPMAPMVPLGEALMPVSPHELPISPFERQLVAQSAPTYSPASPSAGSPSTIPPGMMPMQERQGNVAGIAPQQNTQWQHSAPQQFPPNTHGLVASGNNSRGQITPHTQYVVPPGYMLPPHQVVPQNMPIPSGVSTLPPQGGQTMQPHGMPMQYPHPQGAPAPGNPSDFHFYNVPPTHRRVF